MDRQRKLNRISHPDAERLSLRSQKRLVDDMKNFNAPKHCDGFPVLVFFDRKLDPSRRLHPQGQCKSKRDKTGSLVSNSLFRVEKKPTQRTRTTTRRQ